MTTSLRDLHPRSAWGYFADICAIPHGSGNEEPLAQAVMQWAQRAGCAADRDEAGNVRIRVPASPGRERAPGVVLQAHLDMVCEKNADTDHDFDRDPIVPRVDGEWVRATGTTLGADNGAGLAIALAFLHADTPHGPLEILCTVDEERGLVGAKQLRKHWLDGRLLINTDTEEAGTFIVGCAGGFDADYRLAVRREEVGRAVPFAVSLGGLQGGHSGMDIHTHRGNALVLLAAVLQELADRFGARLAAIDGGDKHNAIPREAKAVVWVPDEHAPGVAAYVAERAAFWARGLPPEDGAFFVRATRLDEASSPLVRDDAARVLHLLTALPCGVLGMHRRIAGIVESSSNTAKVRTESDAVSVLTSARSAHPGRLHHLRMQAAALAALAGAEVHVHHGYPPWEPDFDAPLVRTATAVWRDRFGEEPAVTVIHAGLECGIIREHYPDMQVLSAGPTIEDPHSPQERLHIPSVERVHTFLGALLDALSR